MDAMDLTSLIEHLEDNIDELKEALERLLHGALSHTTAKFPLLDKAKLYVLVTYSIESLLFSYLRLSGVNAKEHPVFRELIRVKQYFQKIKDIGSNNDMRIGPTLDKSAAGRFIKHALAASDVHDPRKVQRQISEKTHIRFNQSSNNLGVEEKNRSTPDIKSSSSSCSELNSLDSRNTQRSHIHKQSVSNAKRKHDGSIEGTSTTASTIGNQGHGDVTNKEKANKKRKTKKQGL